MCRNDFHAGCEFGVAISAQASPPDPAPSVQTIHFGAGTNFSAAVIHAKLESLRKAAAMGKDAGKFFKIVLFFIKNAKKTGRQFLGLTQVPRDLVRTLRMPFIGGITIRAFLT